MRRYFRYVGGTTPGLQAQLNGLRSGMTIKTIDGQQYTKALLQKKMGLKRPYKVPGSLLMSGGQSGIGRTTLEC